jgi:1-acyl-sn-glycerol-3-phosphate acyltransferase
VIGSRLPVLPEVKERVGRLELAFNEQGFDPLGLDKQKLIYFFSFLAFLYRRYFRVKCFGIEHVPSSGRAMLVGNHTGGIPVDGGMVLASLLLDHDPPRLGHGMVEKFVANLPFLSYWWDRVGQFTGLPEHAVGLLERDRVLVVFPEGVRGVGKLAEDGYELERFGTGFLRLALETKTPVIPFAFVGGVEAMPTVGHLERLARALRVPYIPITPYLLPMPLPLRCVIVYGEAMSFAGDGSESDEVIAGWVGEVQARIRSLIDDGLARRRELGP